MANNSVPMWQQAIHDRMAAFAPKMEEKSDSYTEPKMKQEESPTDVVQQELNNIVDSFLAQQHIPSNVETFDKDPSELAGTGEAAGLLEKFAFGAVKGHEEYAFMENVEDYALVNHPEVAFLLGMTREGVAREKGLPEDDLRRNPVYQGVMGALGIQGMMLKDPVATGYSMVTKTLGRVFKSEQETMQIEAEQMRQQFGDGWMEMSPDQRREVLKTDADKLLKEVFPDVYGTQAAESIPARVGEFAGALADPTTVLPAGGSYKAAMAIGAGIGASDAAMYDLAKTGKIDPMHVAVGTGLGGILGPAIRYVGEKGGRFVSKQLDAKRANKILDKYENLVLQERKLGVAIDFSHNTARQALGLTSDSVKDLYKYTGRIFKDADTPIAAREALEMRASWLQKNRTIAKIGHSVDKFITPVFSRMERLSPRIAHAMRTADATSHVRTHLWFERTNPFLNKWKKLTKTDQFYLHKALMNSDRDTILSIVKQYEKSNPAKFKGFQKELNEMRKVLQEAHAAYKSAGYKLEYTPWYFPRVWRHPDRMGDIQKGLFNQAVTTKQKELGRPLNSKEVQDIIRGLMYAPSNKAPKAKTSGALRERTIEEVNEGLMKFYANPIESMHSYLRAASVDIERAKFFKKFGYKGEFTSDGKEMIGPLDQVIEKEGKRLGWKPEETQDVIEMVRARFFEGEQSPHRFIQTMKNIGYSTTLGNPLSAITQLGDNAFGMFKYGIHRVGREVLRGLVGRRDITKMDLGLADAVEELYANSSKSKRALNAFLKYSGFNTMDRFGKENIMNAALKKVRDQVNPTKKGFEKSTQQFTAKWGKYFENDTPALIRDLRQGKMTDNVKLLMWYELADVQPIALSEMPQKYLEWKSGRLLYMLKTFTVKQIDFMRRNIIQEFAKGNVTKGTKNLAAFTGFWLLANGTADGLKAVMTGSDFDIPDNMVENVLQMVAWSRYQSLQTAKEGPMTAAVEWLMPPTNFIDNIYLGITQGDVAKLVEPIPIVGKYIYKASRAQEQQTKALRSRGGIPLSGGGDSAIRKRALE